MYDDALIGKIKATIVFGGCTTLYCNRGMYSAIEAQSIDRKIDDSFAGTGIFRSVGNSTSGTDGCTDQLWSSSTPGVYQLTNPSKISCTSILYLD